jgi:hypothetical protein
VAADQSNPYAVDTSAAHTQTNPYLEEAVAYVREITVVECVAALLLLGRAVDGVGQPTLLAS